MNQFTCNHCDREVRYTDEQAGTRIDCPLCGRPVTVPAPHTPSYQLPTGSNALLMTKPGPLTPAPLVPQTFWQRSWKFVLGGLFVFGAAFLILMETKAVRDYFDSERWPKTRGKVEMSVVQKHVIRAKGIPITSYKPAITYLYLVGPLTYRSTNICFGESYTLSNGTSETTARNISERFPPGKHITVLHDPSDPFNVVIERRIDRATYTTLGAMLGLGLLGMRLLLVSLAPFAFEREARWWGIFERRRYWYDYGLIALFFGCGFWQIALMPFIV